MKKRLGRIIAAYTYDNKPITAGNLKAVGAMAVLLKDAMKPNLVQKIEGVPAFIHGGPFANIAHGTNSLIATKMALKLADYVVTEAGFGSELGAEKFFNIVCRTGDLKPDAVVLLVSIKALKKRCPVFWKARKRSARISTGYVPKMPQRIRNCPMLSNCPKTIKIAKKESRKR